MVRSKHPCARVFRRRIPLAHGRTGTATSLPVAPPPPPPRRPRSCAPFGAMTRGQDQQHRLLYELCALVFSILQSLSLEVPWSDALPQEPATVPRPSSAAAGRPRVSAAGLTSLLLGMSLSLMLFGSVTFVIGFMLMPWVIGVVMLFYFVGLVSSLSILGRSIFCSTPVSPRSPRKEMPGRHCISTRQTREEFHVWQ